MRAKGRLAAVTYGKKLRISTAGCHPCPLQFMGREMPPLQKYAHGNIHMGNPAPSESIPQTAPRSVRF